LCNPSRRKQDGRSPTRPRFSEPTLIPAGSARSYARRGIEYASTLKISDSIVAANSAVGGEGGGAGEGGGVFNCGTSANASLTDVLITLNSAIGGSGGGKGYGGRLYVGTGAITTLSRTKVVGDFATAADNNIYGAATTD
jgi:hypothetical protein